MAAWRCLLAAASSLPDRIRTASGSIRLAVLMAFLVAAGFVVNLFHRMVPELLWLPTLVNAVVATVAVWRTSCVTSLPGPTRRFWSHLCLVVGLVGLGSVAQAIDLVTHPGYAHTHTSSTMLVFDGAATVFIVYALFRLPLGKRTIGERVRVGLDAGTVMLATAVFVWHLQTRYSVGANGGSALVASLVITALALVAVFAVAKVMLSSFTFIERGALRLLGAGILVGTASSAFLQPLASTPHLYPTQLSIPIVFLLATWAAERQRHSAHHGRRRGAFPRHSRSFSLLPYAAIAAVDGLLSAVTWAGDETDEGLVVGSAVVLTGLVVIRQVTAFRDNGRLLAQLDHVATHDTLTDLPNRMLFGQRLQAALADPESRSVSVALVDLDDFKEVNDTLGHETGDQLLVAIGRRLNACVPTDDMVARLGGDEFVVVLDGADPAATDVAIGRMIAAFREPVLAGGHELAIRASIGIADGHTGDEASVLLQRADIAMYAAKKLSGTASLHYEDGMATSSADDVHLGNELRDAITGEQLFLLFQPIVSLDDGRMIGVEALVRWAHPVRGMLTPDCFIPLAERTGLIVPLGRWVFRAACQQLAAWVAEPGDVAPPVININVSARDLREPGLAADVASILAEFDLSADRIAVEVTESMVLELGTSIGNLHQLRATGVRISLDDFGTGNSTLSLLHDCPVDEIKLDRSFVRAEIDDRPSIAAAVLHLAHVLGLHAVAEGVESAEQAKYLHALGYVAAQGYYFARPVPAATMHEMLRRPSWVNP